jgi:predicted nucleic acid-binding protein
VGNWNKEAIYWDSCVFLAWFKGEARPNGEINGVLDCVEKVEKGQIILVTYKSITEIEVLEASMSVDAKQKFHQLFLRRNVQYLPHHPRIEVITKEIREYYQREHLAGNGKNVGSSDAMHLASAIYYQVDAFYTFDDGRGKKERGLLELSGNVAGHNLLICKPPFTEMRLFL